MDKILGIIYTILSNMPIIQKLVVKQDDIITNFEDLAGYKILRINIIVRIRGRIIFDIIEVFLIYK